MSTIKRTDTIVIKLVVRASERKSFHYRLPLLQVSGGDYLEAVHESYTDPNFGVTLRCALHRACTHCGAKVGIIHRSGPHWKLNCAVCGFYIKFIGKYHVAQ